MTLYSGSTEVVDAYEIGMELATPDEMGAGLALMQEQLAQLEAAVAASFADAPGLIEQSGQQAGNPVASAAPDTQQAVLPVKADGELATDPAMQGTVADGKRTEAGERIATVAAAKRGAASFSESASAPPRETSALAPGENTGRRPLAGEAEVLTAAPVVVSARIVPAVAAAVAATPSRDGEAASPVGAVSSMAEPGPGTAGPGSEVAVAPMVRADVQRAERGHAMPPEAGEGSRHGHRSRSRHATYETATLVDGSAPPSSVGEGTRSQAGPRPASSETGMNEAAAPTGGLFGERAAAPQPEASGGRDGGGGTVVLDGRLVGQWLSEQMGRDASRPGAGTTFFDPRQAPAWTPSGAL